MRKALVSLAAAAALAVAASGCGASDAGPADIAKAAETTRQEETAAFDVSLSLEGFGLPRKLSLRGAGATALDEVRMEFDFELSDVLELAGLPDDFAPTRFVVRGGDLFVDPPPVRGLDLPGDASWVRVDLAKLVEASGLDARGLGDVMAIDPSTQLAVLRAAEGVEEVGTERVQGVETTHLRGEVRLSDYARTLPPDRRRRALDAIEQLAASEAGSDVDAPTPFDVWVDGEDRVRRMRQSGKVPGRQGVPGGRFSIALDLDAFGEDLRLDEPPPPSKVFDATRAITEATAR